MYKYFFQNAFPSSSFFYSDGGSTRFTSTVLDDGWGRENKGYTIGLSLSFTPIIISSSKSIRKVETNNEQANEERTQQSNHCTSLYSREEKGKKEFIYICSADINALSMSMNKLVR